MGQTQGVIDIQTSNVKTSRCSSIFGYKSQRETHKSPGLKEEKPDGLESDLGNPD